MIRDSHTLHETKEPPEFNSEGLKEIWPENIKMLGYVRIPTILFRNQRDLDISSDELNVLLQLLSFWWVSNRLPYPAKKTIANRIGRSERTIQRHITSLEKKGLIEREKRSNKDGGQTSNIYRFDGLINRLNDISIRKSRPSVGT